MTRRTALLLSLCAILPAMLGCGTEPERKPAAVGLQPANDTPQNTILRLIAAYEQKKIAEYAALFPADFRFEFSNASDPTLAQKYPGGWFAQDESLSAKHLFEGFSHPVYGYLRGASSIDLTFASTMPGDDTDGRDPVTRRTLATRVDGSIVVPPSEGQTEETRYVFANSYHRLFLVRGDSAQALRPWQPADSGHWYVWHWTDETAQPVAPSGEPRAEMPQGWGRVKGLYR